LLIMRTRKKPGGGIVWRLSKAMRMPSSILDVFICVEMASYYCGQDGGRALVMSGAEQGDAVGQYKLGVLYERGDGVSEDKKEAARWYRRAAEQRHEEA